MTSRAELIPHDTGYRSCSGVAPGKEVSDVKLRSLKCVLQPKGVDHKQSIVEVEGSDESSVREVLILRC